MSLYGQGIKCRRNIAENYNRLSRVHERYKETTDRRQTDGRQHILNVNGEREFTFVKMDADHFFRIGRWRLVWSTKPSTEIEGPEMSIKSKTELLQCEDC